MSRRRFDHLYVEICVSLGQRIPRYPLWLLLHECGVDPESFSRAEALAFCDGPLDRFLEDERLPLSPRARRRLRKSVRRFDPGDVTPYERLASWGESG